MPEFCKRVVTPRIRIVKIAPGKPGTIQVAQIIGRMICAGTRDFFVRQKAIEIFREAEVKPKDRWGEVCALFSWVQKNIIHTRYAALGTAAYTAPHAGIAGGRLRRHDDSARIDAEVDGASGANRSLRIPAGKAAFLQSHLSGSSGAPAMDCVGRNDVPSDRMGSQSVWKRVCLVTEEGLQCSSKIN